MRSQGLVELSTISNGSTYTSFHKLRNAHESHYSKFSGKNNVEIIEYIVVTIFPF